MEETAVVTNSDYNNLIREYGALIAERQRTFGGSEIYDAVYNWQNWRSQDVNSLSHEPLFANEGGGDFHLQSLQGRWIPGSGYTNDLVHSPMIDAGDLSYPFIPANPCDCEPPAVRGFHLRSVVPQVVAFGCAEASEE